MTRPTDAELAALLRRAEDALYRYAEWLHVDAQRRERDDIKANRVRASDHINKLAGAVGAAALALGSAATPEARRTTPAPQFAHDCDHCVFLGQFAGYDLYWCGKVGSTLIARFGHEGSDYYSGIQFEGGHPAIGEAGRRARDKFLPVWVTHRTPEPTS